jgi:hypothetical protein
MQFLMFGIFFGIGLVGGFGHWAKKRYIDNTTDDSFLAYIKYDKVTTIKALGGIMATAYALAVSHTGGIGDILLSEVGMALGVSYASDSTFNQASDSKELK